MHEEIIETLYKESLVHGFISESQIFQILEDNKVSLLETDYIVDQLLLRGVIIKDDSDADTTDDIDKSQFDYESVFREAIEMDDRLEDLINYIRSIKPPQSKEWQILMPQAKNGNQFARTRLFEMYMRNVVRIVIPFVKKYNQPLGDTLQNGFIGLHVAIDKFEYGKQDTFSTYFPWWVMQNIRRDLETTNPTVYYPVHMKERIVSCYDLLQDHFCEECLSSGYCPNLIKEIQLLNDCSIDAAKAIIDSTVPYESLEYLIENDLIDNYLELAYDDLFININNALITNVINNVLDSLTERERIVIKMRYGMDDGKVKTLEEIGNIMGVTRERIRQIEDKSLRKLRHPTKSKKLKALL